MTIVLRHCLLLIALLLSARPGFAQWTSQTITLRPGWNAVFLEIQPEPKECDTNFAGLPVESVWAWNKRHSPVQFIQDPDKLITGQPDWLAYLPPSHMARARMNLFILQGNHAYLIKLPDNATPITWTVHGRPVLRRMDWLSDSFNFVGFPVESVNAPTFQDFFAGSPAHAGQPVYRLVNGLWQRVTSPSSTRLNRGEAYWTFCRGQSAFAGPLEAAVEQRSGLDYGRILTEQTFTIRNRSLATRTFTLRQLPSAAPSGTVYPSVPLYYFRMTLAINDVGWFPLPAPLAKSLGPGQEWNIRLEARRAEMGPFTPSPGAAAPLYQSLLEISDGAGSRSMVGVTARGLQSYPAVAGGGGGGAGAAFSPASLPHRRAGLWVGSASITNVSQPASFNPTTPVPTASPFQFRVLIHVDDAGQARLLQKVLQMWKDGTTRPDPDNPDVQITDQPGRYVLVTDGGFIPNFSGATLRDGRAVARRISAAAFGFRDPIAMTGAGEFGAAGSQFACAVSLSHTNPLNPFVHRYHPDHNNLDEQDPPQPLTVKTNATGQLYTAESTGIERALQFQFTSTDPDDLRLPGWQDDQLGGIYRETLTGLHKGPLYIQGTFRVQHASRVGILNDGL